MPRGIYERKKSTAVVSEDLSTHDELTWEIANLFQEYYCTVAGCQPKWHLEEANKLVRKLIQLGLINDSEK